MVFSSQFPFQRFFIENFLFLVPKIPEINNKDQKFLIIWDYDQALFNPFLTEKGALR